MLYPGDFLEIGSFSSWDFYSDSNYGFHFFANESSELYHEYTVEEGKDLQGKGFDPRKLLAPGTEAIKATVKEKIELFGSANRA